MISWGLLSSSRDGEPTILVTALSTMKKHPPSPFHLPKKSTNALDVERVATPSALSWSMKNTLMLKPYDGLRHDTMLK